MLRFAALLLSLIVVQPSPAARLKDLVAIEGVRENQLIGYGLVVGLAGDGDSNDDGVHGISSLDKGGLYRAERAMMSGGHGPVR